VKFIIASCHSFLNEDKAALVQNWCDMFFFSVSGLSYSLEAHISYAFYYEALFHISILIVCFLFGQYWLCYGLMQLATCFKLCAFMSFIWSTLSLRWNSLLMHFCQNCPYVLEAITDLVELGSTAKDIILLIAQVCW